MITARDLKDTHVGETGIIVGNGPSLKDIPLSFLRSKPSFGTNRIYLLEGFTPTYYASVNPLVLTQFADEIREKTKRCRARFISSRVANSFQPCFSLYSVPMPTFSRDPLHHVFEGFTVTFVAMQLAFFMGFKTILLVGIDHQFQFEGAPNEEKTMSGADPNHFSPEYFQGVQWNNPDLERSQRSYEMAKSVFEFAGRKIINCSTRTALDTFERADWREYA